MIELTPLNIAIMVGVFAAVMVTFVICVRRELK